MEDKIVKEIKKEINYYMKISLKKITLIPNATVFKRLMILRSKIQELRLKETNFIEEIKKALKDSKTVGITCKCGKYYNLLRMYQCFYCKEFFCEECAKIHFDKECDKKI